MHTSVAPGFAPLPFVTPPAWADAQWPHRAELLVEQAHLEKKAASAALALLFRLPAGHGHERELSALAREELVHFERSLKLGAARGIAFVGQVPCEYAERLKRAVRREMPQRLVDELLMAAIVETRSCERMGRLAEAFAGRDAELADFYADLVAAEARHGCLYAELACELVGSEAAARRWSELAAHEAAVLAALPFAPRLHSGLPAAVAAPGEAT
ncbi:MAG: hypothetical protein RL398_988 [Planctomycetota bacterium]|jgi:tRNA-(ms[2]io[6]A)-hydroxylase